jgi:cysteinyl-tRNA synthetase
MKHIKLYNTLTQKVETLKNAKPIKMYCCGVTPYSHTHIGHARTFFSFDLLIRVLKDHALDVVSVRNITDIDDKIINRALEEHISCEALVTKFVTEQHSLLAQFELIKPDFEPKVTESIPEILNIISILLEKEFAYVTNTGVYFRVKKFSAYGKLSKNHIDHLRHGVRIAEDETKEDSLDFALWKFSKQGEPVSFEAPWGKGRPGWHIECSAMIHKILGTHIDIHMGGRDLIFPHHEAEIAQSEAAFSQELASFWLHVGMVTLYGEKMSKSTKKLVTLQDFLEKHPPEVLRLFFLSAHYSQPLDFSYEIIEENLKKLSRGYRFLALMESYKIYEEGGHKTQVASFIGLKMAETQARMREALGEDLNTPLALSAFFEFVRFMNASLNQMEKDHKSLSKEDHLTLLEKWPSFVVWLNETLGLFKKAPSLYFEELRSFAELQELSLEEIEVLITKRNEARALKNWAEGDRIRDELAKAGIKLNDGRDKTTWTVEL